MNIQMWLSSQTTVALQIDKHIHEIKKRRQESLKSKGRWENNELGKVEDCKLER